MKKIFRMAVSICFLICSLSARSQLQKGNVLLGADIANLDLSLNTGSNFSALLNPKFARFIQNDFALGGYINFRISTAKGAGTSVRYGIGPLARYYFDDGTVNLTSHARFFVEANAGFEGSNPAVGNSTNGLGLGFGPGIAYFMTQNIGLEALLKYQGIIGFGSSVTTSDLTMAFGVQIYLPHKTLEQASGMKQ
jgi:hypothetical protein